MTRRHILIVAQNASYRFGGEAVLPLHYFTRLAERGHSVTLIAHARNRAELEAALPALADRMRYTPDTALQQRLWRIGARFPAALREHLFGTLMALDNGRQLRRLIRAEIATQPIEVIHQPIPVSPAAPSMIHGFGVPVVIGPMNGAMRYPPGYEQYLRLSERLFVALGRRAAGLVNRLIPGKRRAALLLVANQRTAEALPVSHGRVRELVENGVDLARWPSTPAGPPEPGAARMRLVFIGRLVRWKALHITLDALAHLRHEFPALEVTLDVIGDGPERARLTLQATRAGLADRVVFHGFQPQEVCAAHLARAQALILNSLFECGGAVVLEAMAAGKPVIASDWGGPADYLDSGCGLLVPPSPPETFAARLAEAIRALALDPGKAVRMGQAGLERARSLHDWNRKIAQIETFYDEAIRYQSPSS